MGYESGERQAGLFLEKKKNIFPTCIKHASKILTATLKISLQLNIPPYMTENKNM